MRRMVAVLAVIGLMSVGFASSAEATGVCSHTVRYPKQAIGVHGKDKIPGETALLRFDTKVIGGTTVDGFGNYIVDGRIPGSAMPGLYTISVTFDTSPTDVPCTVKVRKRR